MLLLALTIRTHNLSDQQNSCLDNWLFRNHLRLTALPESFFASFPQAALSKALPDKSILQSQFSQILPVPWPRRPGKRRSLSKYLNGLR